MQKSAPIYLPPTARIMLFGCLLLFCASASLKAQAPPNGWPLFEQVEFGKKFFKSYGMLLPWPKNFDNIRQWEGKEVMLSGYIIPTADAPGYSGLILSKFTYSQCFFCGKAGLASVAEVIMKKPIKDYKIDRPYVFKGKLKFNEDDPDRLIFILENAELMEL